MKDNLRNDHIENIVLDLGFVQIGSALVMML